MKKLAVLLFLIALSPSLVYAQSANLSSSTTAELQTQIQELLKQVQVLQQQVTALKVELGQQPETAVSAVPPELIRNLYRGSSGDDVRGLQEFLSQDKEIYPEGLVTGYFGPLTEGAVKRWQEKHDIESIGIIGPKTIARFNEFRGQTATPAIPAQPVGLTGTTTIPAIPAQTATATTMRPRLDSCAASYNYCVGPGECSANGYYWCRNSCYGSVDACLGQTFVPPAVSATPAVPATPAIPISVTSTSTVPAVPATPATSSNTTSLDWTILTNGCNPKAVLNGSEYGLVWSKVCNSGENEIYFNRFTSAGVKISQDLLISTGHLTADSNYILAQNGTEYAVIWEDYWGNVALHSNTYSSYSTYFSRMNSQGQKSGADIKIATGGQYNQMNLFWNGSEYVLIYINYRPNEIRFRKFSPDGQPLGSIKTIGGAGKEIDKLSVVSTGTEYILSWNYYAAFGGGSESVRLSASGDLINQTSPSTTTDTIAPSTPTGLTATAVSSSQINLSWTASTDNVGVSGYKLYRSWGGYGYITNFTISSGVSYSDIGLSATTTYSYIVAAYDAAGNISAQSSPVSATTVGSLSQVQGLTAAVSGSSVALSWQPVPEWNGGPTTGGYNIYRGTTADFVPSPIPSNPTNLIVQGNVLSYTNSNLSPGTYYYKVAYQNNSGTVGPASTATSAVILAPPATTTSYNLTPSRERLNQLASVLDAIKSALGELLKILK